MCRCSQRGGNKGCCCRLMPAQLWHAPTWAVGAGGAHTRGGTGEGYQPPVDVQGGFQGLCSSWMLEVSLQLLLLQGGMAFCWDLRGVHPWWHGGVEGCLGQSGWRGLGGTRWRWLGDRRELWLQHGGFGWETQSAIPWCTLGVWGLVSLLGIRRDGNG